MHHPTDRITHTTAFVTPVVEHWLEREIAQWVHPMKDRTMSERSTSELRPAPRYLIRQNNTVYKILKKEKKKQDKLPFQLR